MSILTNNFAVLRCYTEISGLRQVQLPDESMTELASYIKPNSTGGELQSEYAAFVGPDAIATLEKYRERMGDAHIIGLLAANWVRVIGGQAYPVAMYRDELQGKFKEAFVGICDEVYLPVPLGKVFVNRGASLIKFPEGNGGVRQYHDVPVNEKRATKTRLVTTSRAGELLLGRHSKNLMEAITLGPVACATSFPSGEAFTPIEQVPWRVLPFDEPSRWGKDEMNKEFPHEYSRDYQVLEGCAVRVGAK